MTNQQQNNSPSAFMRFFDQVWPDDIHAVLGEEDANSKYRQANPGLPAVVEQPNGAATVPYTPSPAKPAALSPWGTPMSTVGLSNQRRLQPVPAERPQIAPQDRAYQHNPSMHYVRAQQSADALHKQMLDQATQARAEDATDLANRMRGLRDIRRQLVADIRALGGSKAEQEASIREVRMMMDGLRHDSRMALQDLIDKRVARDKAEADDMYATRTSQIASNAANNVPLFDLANTQLAGRWDTLAASDYKVRTSPYSAPVDISPALSRFTQIAEMYGADPELTPLAVLQINDDVKTAMKELELIGISKEDLQAAGLPTDGVSLWGALQSFKSYEERRARDEERLAQAEQNGSTQTTQPAQQPDTEPADIIDIEPELLPGVAFGFVSPNRQQGR